MCRRPVVLIWLLPLGLVGCGDEPASGPRPAAAEQLPPAGQQPSPSAAQADTRSAVGDPVTPSDTVRRVNELRRAGRLQDMAQYVTRERRQPVIELIQAVDQLILDNQVLQERIRASGATASAALFDRSSVANIIGVFSTDVEIIQEDVTDTTAVVTVQVA
ncbi:MAG: hypothetical protein ACYSVY_19140, partial [Planctomycetota bacterium]